MILYTSKTSLKKNYRLRVSAHLVSILVEKFSLKRGNKLLQGEWKPQKMIAEDREGWERRFKIPVLDSRSPGTCANNEPIECPLFPKKMKNSPLLLEGRTRSKITRQPSLIPFETFLNAPCYRHRRLLFVNYRRETLPNYST